MEQKIIIEIRGGVLVAVYARDPAVEVVLVDWDEIEAGSTKANTLFPVETFDQMPVDTQEAVGECGSRGS